MGRPHRHSMPIPSLVVIIQGHPYKAILVLKKNLSVIGEDIGVFDCQCRKLDVARVSPTSLSPHLKKIIYHLVVYLFATNEKTQWMLMLLDLVIKLDLCLATIR